MVIQGHGLNNSPNLISLNVKGMKIMTTNTQIAIKKKRKKYDIIKYDNKTNTKTFGKDLTRLHFNINYDKNVVYQVWKIRWCKHNFIYVMDESSFIHNE